MTRGVAGSRCCRSVPSSRRTSRSTANTRTWCQRTGGRRSASRSGDRGWPALRAVEKRGLPLAHGAGVAERRAGELERGGVWIRRGSRVLPVEQVQAEAGLPARRSWLHVALGEPVGRRVRVGVEG